MNSTALALQVRDLDVGRDGLPVVRGVDLELRYGEWCALVGPNGCGKTTLLESIAGRLPSLSGSIRIAGHDLSTARRPALRRLGYALPPDQLPGRLTLRECLRLFACLHERDAVAPIVDELLGPWSLRSRLDDSVDQCSLGTRQKLAILLALVADPPLLVLDESFNGLDPRSALILEERLDARLAAGDFAVIMATHALELVRRHAHATVLIDGGRVATRLNRRDIQSAGDGLRELLASRQSAI